MLEYASKECAEVGVCVSWMEVQVRGTIKFDCSASASSSEKGLAYTEEGCRLWTEEGIFAQNLTTKSVLGRLKP